MHVQFLYFDDCPSHSEALERVRRVLTEEATQATLDIIRVETEEQARHLRFPGSPTIRVDEQDIALEEAGMVYGLSCRAYHLEDGRISPLPPLTLIRTAVQRATAAQQAAQQQEG